MNNASKCISCDYNLHGLPAESRCPECHLEIFISAGAPGLYHASRTWLAAVIVGGAMLALAPLPRILAIVAFQQKWDTFFGLLLFNALWTIVQTLLIAPPVSGTAPGDLPPRVKLYSVGLVVALVQILLAVASLGPPVARMPLLLIKLLLIFEALLDPVWIALCMDRLGSTAVLGAWSGRERRMGNFLQHLAQWVGRWTVFITLTVAGLGVVFSELLEFRMPALTGTFMYALIAVVGMGGWFIGAACVNRALLEIACVWSRKHDRPWLMDRMTQQDPSRGPPALHDTGTTGEAP